MWTNVKKKILRDFNRWYWNIAIAILKIKIAIKILILENVAIKKNLLKTLLFENAAISDVINSVSV